MEKILARTARLLRSPGGGGAAPKLCHAPLGLRFAEDDRNVPFENGILDLVGGRFRPTFTQRTLDTRVSAWAYDVLRDSLAPMTGMPRFLTEVDEIVEALSLRPGDTVVDLACGHGNFTVEIARRIGPEGLVIGVDISAAMLRRAAARVRREELGQVMLIRGDALALPFATAGIPKLNCSGGLHQFPDLDRALAEIARVLAPGGPTALSTFASDQSETTAPKRILARRAALHVIRLPMLGRKLEAAGFTSVHWHMLGRAFGRATALRSGSDA
jgi:ubiquinone/menaquinone biosynthesis C-methylase UbiE